MIGLKNLGVTNFSIFKIIQKLTYMLKGSYEITLAPASSNIN